MPGAVAATSRTIRGPQSQNNGCNVTLLFFRRLGHRLHPDASQILVGLEQVVTRALDDFEEIVHRRNFLELLSQKPLQKVDRDVILFVAGQLDQRIDLMGHFDLLIEGKLENLRGPIKIMNSEKSISSWHTKQLNRSVFSHT